MLVKNKKEPDMTLSISSASYILKLPKITDIPLREDAVIRKCKDIYNDPSPCYIRKNAICALMFEEIRMFLLEFASFCSDCNEVISYEKIPESIKSYIDFNSPYNIWVSRKNC